MMLNAFRFPVAGHPSLQIKKFSSSLPPPISSQIPLTAFNWVLGVETKRTEALPENICHPHTATVFRS